MTDLFSWKDRELSFSEDPGATIVLEQPESPDETVFDEQAQPFDEERVYGEMPLPFAGERREAAPSPPERIRQMRRLYEYGRESAQARAENFYRQAKFMEDFEDDAPWSGSFAVYYPTYQDLTTSQLRGYFSWRTRARRGEFSPIAASAAYLYLYELLNGIGVSTPEESFEKLREFREGFLDAGFGDAKMLANVNRWMPEFAVVKDLPVSFALECTDPAILQMDAALGALLSAEDDAEVLTALCRLGGKKYEKSPAFAEASGRGRRLLAGIWRKAKESCRPEGKEFFEACFGRRVRFLWQPLANALYYDGQNAYGREEISRLRPGTLAAGTGMPRERVYVLTACRSYICRDGKWQMEAYDKVFFHLHWLKELLHAADARLRRYLGTGKYLTEKPEEVWAQPLIDAVLREDARERAEAARPEIRLNLAGLDKIRSDALVTQNSLLVEEELGGERLSEAVPETKQAAAGGPAEGKKAGERSLPESNQAGARSLPEGDEAGERSLPESNDIGRGGSPEGEAAGGRNSGGGAAGGILDAVQTEILLTLLRGEPVDALLRENHRMPSLTADEINELLYDEFGDNVLDCEDDCLSIFEDYREELRNLLEP